MMNYKEIKELLKKRGIPYKEFQFEGHSLGRIEKAFPKAGKDYHTVRYGWLVSFYLGGKVVAGDGKNWVKKWVRVAEIFRKGDPSTPSFYSAIYIRSGDFRNLISEGIVDPIFWSFPEYEVQRYRPNIQGEKLYRIVPTSFESGYIVGEDYVLHKDYIGWFSAIFFGTSTSIRELISRIEKYENARGNKKYKIIY